jgi:hypothetical protein
MGFAQMSSFNAHRSDLWKSNYWPVVNRKSMIYIPALSDQAIVRHPCKYYFPLSLTVQEMKRMKNAINT